MAVRGNASGGPRPEALRCPPWGPKAPDHKIGGSRRSGRPGEPPGQGGSASGCLAAIWDSGAPHRLRPLLPAPLARRIAKAISMGQY